MREHAAAVSQHEPRIVTDGRRHVPHLHPALCLPPQELDLFRRQMRAACHRRRPVVLVDAVVDDQAARDEIARHRRAGIGRRMLDVRPIHVLAREREVCRNRLPRVVGVADDEAADDEHAVLVQEVDGPLRRVAGAASALARRVLRARLQEVEIVVEDVLDAEKHVAEPCLAHQRRQLLTVRGDRRRHPLHHVVDVVEAGVDNRLAQRREAVHVECDVVVDDEEDARAAAPRIGDVLDDPRHREAVEVAAAHLDDRAEAAVVGAAA